MAKIFCIANQKGGVGKTTTGVNLAASLAATRQRVLLIDLDPQGNATMGSGIDKRALTRTIYHVLLGESDIAGACITSPSGAYQVVPANRELAGAEVELVDIEHRETRLKDAVAVIEADYDYVLIDCPPSLGLLTLNSLVAADGVVIPLHCEYFALEGLADLVATMRRVRSGLNPSLDIEGVLLTMNDERTNLGQQVGRDVREFFKEKVYRTVIPRNVRLAEAPSHGLPAVTYDAKSRGAEAYFAFAREVLERNEPALA